MPLSLKTGKSWSALEESQGWDEGGIEVRGSKMVPDSREEETHSISVSQPWWEKRDPWEDEGKLSHAILLRVIDSCYSVTF